MKNSIKIFCALAVFILTTTQADAQWRSKKVEGNGNVTTKTVNTGDYDEISVVGFMDVHLEKGTEGTISVTTDDNLHEYLEIETDGDKLVLKTKKGYNLRTRKGVHITVPFSDISEVSITGSGDVDNKDTIDGDSLDLRVTGSGDIDLDVNVRSLEAKITGSGDVTLNGKTRDLEVTISGSGDFKGFNLASENTEATVSGSGDVSVQAKNSIRARVNGSGDIKYTGSPAKSDTKVSGSGRISSSN